MQGSCLTGTVPMFPAGSSAVGTPSGGGPLCRLCCEVASSVVLFPNLKASVSLTSCGGITECHLFPASRHIPISALCRRICCWIWTSGTPQKINSLAEFV